MVARNSLRFATLIVVLLSAVDGCRRGSEPVAPRRATEAEARADLEDIDASDVGETLQGENAALKFTALRDAVVRGEDDVVISMLPEEWLEEFTIKARTWTAIDPRAREEFVTAAARAARAVDAKSEWIRGSENLILDGPWAAVLRQNLPSLARVAARLAEWPGWVATGEIDAHGLIRALVRAVAGEPELETALGRLEFEEVSRDGNAGVVRYRTDGEGEWNTFPVTRFEGEWIPSRVLRAVERHSQGDTPATEPSRRLRQLAQRLDSFGAVLDDVSTQAEFDAIAEAAAKGLIEPRPTTDAAPRPVADREFVWVEVSGDLSETEADQLLWNTAGQTDAPASAVADLRASDDGSSVRIRVGPVADLRAFAERLPGLTVESIDEKQRTIRASFERDRSPESIPPSF